jgi:epoxide hydrolase
VAGPVARVSWDYGIALDDVRELAEYWRTGYNWRVHERRLNGDVRAFFRPLR